MSKDTHRNVCPDIYVYIYIYIYKYICIYLYMSFVLYLTNSTEVVNMYVYV